MKKMLVGFVSFCLLSSTAHALNGYKLLVKGEEIGGSEYPSMYIETKSLKKNNGFVTATLLEKYVANIWSKSPSGYKMTIQLDWALLHKDLKCKAPLIEPNLRRNLGKWST